MKQMRENALPRSASGRPTVSMEDGAIVKPDLTESCAYARCRSTPSALSLTSERAALIRQAFRLEWMTIAWMVVEGVVALGAGLAAGSLTLMAFGLDSAIELASAGVLIWRLNVELRHGQGFSERAERTASRIGAVLLFTLAAYIVGGPPGACGPDTEKPFRFRD